MASEPSAGLTYRDLVAMFPEQDLVRRELVGGERFIRSAPDLVVEVSSPSTRTLDLTTKKALYERSGVPEYWYVDLEAERVELYRAGPGGFGPPSIVGRGGSLTSPHLPGLRIAVDEVLGPGPGT